MVINSFFITTYLNSEDKIVNLKECSILIDSNYTLVEQKSKFEYNFVSMNSKELISGKTLSIYLQNKIDFENLMKNISLNLDMDKIYEKIYKNFKVIEYQDKNIEKYKIYLVLLKESILFFGEFIEEKEVYSIIDSCDIINTTN